MTDRELALSLRRLYIVTALFAAAGTVVYAARGEAVHALAFLIGAAGAFGNLWLFNWLSRSIAPAKAGGQRRPWGAGLFIGRYVGFLLVLYATVKLLNVSPLPVLFGLLASTAAVLTISVIDILKGFGGKRTV